MSIAPGASVVVGFGDRHQCQGAQMVLFVERVSGGGVGGGVVEQRFDRVV
jgi:hypothetical protein